MTGLLDKAAAALGAVNAWICEIGWWIGAVAVAAMTVVVLVQVFFRYVLTVPLAWSEAFAIYGMIWMTFAVAPAALRRGAYVAIEVLPDLLPTRPRAILEIVIMLLVLLTLAVLLQHSISYTSRGFGRLAPSLPIEMGWIYICMPLGMAGMILVTIEQILRATARLIDPDDHAPAPLNDPLGSEYE